MAWASVWNVLQKQLSARNIHFGATVSRGREASFITQIKSNNQLLTVQKQAAAGGSLEDLAHLADHKLSSSLATVGAQALDHFLAQLPLQELLQLPSAEFDFDLIIVDYFYTEALLSLGYKHNKPTIAIVSSDFANYMQNVQESVVPAACSPIDFDQFTPELGFTERLANIRDCMGRRKQFHNEHYTAQEQLINKYFKCKYSSDFRPIYAIKIGALNFL